MTTHTGRTLVLNPVRSDRAAEFEAFVHDVLEPAVRAHGADVDLQVQMWRARAPESGNAGVTFFAFLADTGELEHLDLVGPFHAFYGEERGEELLQQMDELLVDFDTWRDALRPFEDEAGVARQYWWQMEDVSTIKVTRARTAPL
jgi:hypothetical protein